MVDKVKSILQAGDLKTKITIDNRKGRKYSETTAPLRETLDTGKHFMRTEEREASYQKLIHTMSARTTLNTFNPK